MGAANSTPDDEQSKVFDHIGSANVSPKHGNHETYKAGDGTWWSSTGQQVVYADFSSGRRENGAATAVVWGEHDQQQKRRGLDVSLSHKKTIRKTIF